MTRVYSRADSWKPEEDAKLCDAIAEGRTFRVAATDLPGRSRDACIGRMHRLVEKMDA